MLMIDSTHNLEDDEGGIGRRKNRNIHEYTTLSSSPPSLSVRARWRRKILSCIGGGQTPTTTTNYDYEQGEELQNDEQQQQQRYKKRQNIGIAITLFASYFTVMAAKCALPSTLSMLTAENSGLTININNGRTPQEMMATVLSFSTFAIAFGKILLGPIIDKLGGLLCLKIALVALATLLGIIASAQTFTTFALCWITVDFIFSSCWASSLNAIHQTFDENSWAKQISSLAVAARTGNAVSFLSFSYVLQWCESFAKNNNNNYYYNNGGVSPWRMVFWVSALIQIFPLCLLGIFGGKQQQQQQQCNTTTTMYDGVPTSAPTTTFIESTKTRNHDPNNSSITQQQPSIKRSLQVLKKEASTLEFWMHLISRSSLMLIASFLLFVPSYMTNCFSMTTAQSARVGSIYALGCLLSLTFGSSKFSTLNRRRDKVGVVLGLCGIVVLCSLLQMAHVSGVFVMSSLLGSVTMFLWGLSFAIPFYLPPSLYALRRGGRDSSATIADALDLVAYLLLAWFNGFVVSRDQETPISWLKPFVILTVSGIASMITLPIALILEEKTTTTIIQMTDDDDDDGVVV